MTAKDKSKKSGDEKEMKDDKEKEEKSGKPEEQPDKAEKEQKIESEEKPETTPDSELTEKSVPEEFQDISDQKQRFRRIDLVTAFSFILSVFVFIMVLKIHPDLLNPNEQFLVTQMTKYENQIDQIQLEIKKLEKQSRSTQEKVDPEDLKNIISDLDKIQDASNTEIAALAERIKTDFSLLLSLLDNQKPKNVKQLQRISR